jgi:uncharacterized protein (TIGR02596 family)
LTQSAQIVNDQLSLARQTALTTAHSVEVRLYQYSDPEMPGEASGAPSKGHYRALQAFEIQDSGAAVAVGKMQRLAPSAIIDAGVSGSSSLSTIISSAAASPTVPTATTGQALGVPIPRAGKAYNAATFRFLPDGSTNFTAASSVWYVTVHNYTDGDNLQAPPANFVTIQVDSANGHIRTFRP